MQRRRMELNVFDVNLEESFDGRSWWKGRNLDPGSASHPARGHAVP